jgi:murein DD-endopeptidase MepM/ murein hydrolase activator NlpD
LKTRKLYYTLLLLFFLSNYKLGSAQINTSPIEYEILLSGNFGELRSSGFHTGIDIKTKGREGEIIKAIDDGYISRMQVSTTGYGKVIYITHNNGLKSVYGHLRDFEKKLDSSAKKIQYSLKSYTFNKYFKKNEIVVKKGQIIGYSGNTGTSFGPHLHFEIRTEKDIPINPLKFNG